MALQCCLGTEVQGQPVSVCDSNNCTVFPFVCPMVDRASQGTVMNFALFWFSGIKHLESISYLLIKLFWGGVEFRVGSGSRTARL